MHPPEKPKLSLTKDEGGFIEILPDFPVATIQGEFVFFTTRFKVKTLRHDGFEYEICSHPERVLDLRDVLQEFELVNKFVSDPDILGAFWRKNESKLQPRFDSIKAEVLLHEEHGEKGTSTQTSIGESVQVILTVISRTLSKSLTSAFSSNVFPLKRARDRIIWFIGLPVQEPEMLIPDTFGNGTVGVKKMERMGPRLMSEVEIFFPRGFLKEKPWCFHRKRKPFKEDDAGSFDIIVERDTRRESSSSALRVKPKKKKKKKYSPIIIQRRFGSTVTNLDISEYVFVLTYDKVLAQKMNEGSRTTWSFMSKLPASLSRNPNWPDACEIAYALVPKDSSNRMITVQFYSRAAETKMRVLFDEAGLKEKLESEVKIPRGGISGFFDCEKSEEESELGTNFSKLMKTLVDVKPDARNIYRNVRQTILIHIKRDAFTDDVVFFHRLFQKRKKLLACFKGKRLLQKEAEKALAKTFFEPMENSELKFYQKSYYFWSKKDAIEWSKCVIVLASNEKKWKRSFYEIHEQEIEEKLEESKTKPYLVMKEILEDNDVNGFYINDDFFDPSKEINENYLRMFCLLPKHAKNIEEVAECVITELKRIMGIGNAMNLYSEFRKLRDVLTTMKDRSKDSLSVSVSSVILQLLQSVGGKVDSGDPVGDVKMAIEMCLIDIDQNLMNLPLFKEELLKFSDIYEMCKNIVNLREFSPRCTDYVELIVKLNCASIGGNPLKKLFSTIIKKHAPFMMFHINIGCNKFDFANDHYVHAGIGGSEKIKASFDVDHFYVKECDVVKIAEFIYRFNVEREYVHPGSDIRIVLDNSKVCTCQTFVIEFLDFLYENFESDSRRKKFPFNVFVNGNNAIATWIKYAQGRDIKDLKRKIIVSKALSSSFPEIFVGEYGKKVEFQTHLDLFKFLSLFNDQKKHDALYGRFPDVLVLLKSFCRSFYFEEKKLGMGIGIVTGNLIERKCYFDIDSSGFNIFDILIKRPIL